MYFIQKLQNNNNNKIELIYITYAGYVQAVKWYTHQGGLATEMTSSTLFIKVSKHGA